MNPKGHAACILGAVEAIARSGIPLDGDVIAAFGAGGMPTNALPDADGVTRRHHTGHGVGCSFLLEQGVWADAAVIAKSGWAVAWEEVGLAWCDVTVRGTTPTSVPATCSRTATPSPTRPPWSPLERWFPERARHTPPGTSRPRCGRWRRCRLVADAAFTPAQARMRVDLRIAPDQTPLDARRELAARCSVGRRRRPVSISTSTSWSGSRAAGPIPTTGSAARPSLPGSARPVATHHPSPVRAGPPMPTSSATGASRPCASACRRWSTTVLSSDFGAGMNTVDIDALETLTRYLVRVAIEGTSAGGPELEGFVVSVVVGVLASHTTLMNTKWDEVDHLERAHAFRDALGAARRAIETSGAEVAVIVGPNHFRGFWLDLMPTFTVGVGEVSGAGEHGTPKGPPPDGSRARPVHLLATAVPARVRPGVLRPARGRPRHHPRRAVGRAPGMPIVPVVVNCLAPPLARLDRCVEFGSVIGDASPARFPDRRSP
jgi:hypothetical protein